MRFCGCCALWIVKHGFLFPCITFAQACEAQTLHAAFQQFFGVTTLEE